ncbi:CCAAT/enhancer-binding protein zeta isoform X2 [Syngnathoides biaculeatus]|uniref:CCAAT/enhancer-binding protein zeta isoform X2 n=1 Tax=Syngnathoides biaculeatus TaxID=300417 RepID=UPI002ADE7630|nr:CCAAT/enhancer-binding protein zeta isoform X2 [Syngnathoides biaculeatus]
MCGAETTLNIFYFRVVCSHASSMAAKNKFGKKSKGGKKWRSQHEENIMEEEEEDCDVEDNNTNMGDGRCKVEEDGFSLKDVLWLGGTQADFMLLSNLNASVDMVDGGKKGTIDDLEEGELEKFITKLGLPELSHLNVVADEKDEEAIPKKELPKSKKEKPAEEKASKPQQKRPKVEKKEKTPKGAAAATSGKRDKQNVYEFRQRNVLLLKPGGKWFDLEYSAEGSNVPQDPAVVSSYKALAQRLYEADVEMYKNKKNLQKGANSAWMKTVVSAGVLADRMAAMTVLIQDAPVHMLEHVASLVSMMKKKGNRRMSLMAVDTLRELFLSNLLPGNRKLRAFDQHPFDKLEELASGNRDTRDRRLLLWYFEHHLKHHVAQFVVLLDELAHDTVTATKSKALATAYELLCQFPEQERALLIQLVNKLGDPEYKMAAKASHLLETLLHRHPNMKVVVCCEVERLMFRANISPKAQYYAVCFLSQVHLSHDEEALAAKLIAVYFSFFRACINKKDVETKMLSALLSGVNRAYPYAGTGDEKVKEQMDTLFKVVHLVKFNTAVQALMLLFQVMDAQQSISDRYYVALYRKLLDAGLSTSSRQNMFLNLVYKSLKADTVLRRIKAFVKRLLQVSAEQGATFACGALFLVSEVMRAKPGLKTLLQEEGDAEEAFKDLPEEKEDDDDEEEHFTDADKVEEGAATVQVSKPVASWVHHQNLEGHKQVHTYDPLHRNPLFCGADHAALWELHRLSLHFHPSVSFFAKTLLQDDFIQYSGDPLQDFTLMRFLDRFVFRNPKQTKGKQNTDTSVLQPKKRLNGIFLPVNSEEFLCKEESQIPVDEIFFYRFFKKRQEEKALLRPRVEDDNESVEDVDDDEFEKVLDSCEADSYFTDFPDEDLDFAGNMKGGKRKKGAKDADSDSDSNLDLDDEEVSLGSMDEEDFEQDGDDQGGIFMDPDGNDEDIPELEDHDDEDVDFDDEDDVPEVTPPSKKVKRKSTEALDSPQAFAGKKKKKGVKDRGIFAAAEEFGCMLDNNAGAKFDNVGLNAMANTDKAGVKQLKWESQRDDWIHDRDAKTLRRKKSMFNKKKQFGRGKIFTTAARGNNKRKRK